jgi:hypothetical protein
VGAAERMQKWSLGNPQRRKRNAITIEAMIFFFEQKVRHDIDGRCQ